MSALMKWFRNLGECLNLLVATSALERRRDKLVAEIEFYEEVRLGLKAQAEQERDIWASKGAEQP
jgi:hypothetical protein